ncbi:MAG: glycosyltransferase family 9 protein [Thermodesulfobacteriota bacterium]
MNAASPDPTPRRALVVQLARFGDLLQTKRLVRSLQEAGSDVHLAVDHSLTGLAEAAFPGITAHGLPAHRAGSPGSGELLARTLPALREMASAGFGQVFNLNFSGLNLALAGLFDPATVRGHRMERGQHHMDPWTRQAFRWTRRRRFAGLNLVDLWGWLADAPLPPGEVNPVARPKGGGIGVVLAGRHSRRSLPAKVLSPLVHAVAKTTGARRVALLGAAGERPLARELLATFPAPLAAITQDLAGRTSLADLFEEVAGLDLVMTPDTGTMHLAAHLGAPVMAFFLSSAWCFETGPYGLGHRVWQAAAECAPCLESAPCSADLACLAPFSSRELLRHLAGNPEFEPPPGLLGLVSALDLAGCTCRPVLGEDAQARERAAFRALMAERLGLGVASGPSAEFASLFLHESDWMLDDRAAPHCIEAVG